MDKDVEEVLKREVAEAARILREDGHTVSLKAIQARLDKHFPDDTEPPEDDGKPTPPPPKEDPNVPEGDRRPKSKFSWWPDETPPEPSA